MLVVPKFYFVYRCCHRFGVEYHGSDQGVSMSWLKALEEFNTCPDDADANTVNRHYEVYLLTLLGGVMFTHTNGDSVATHLIWVARRLALDARNGEGGVHYSWGSAVLADTYRALCDACRRSSENSILAGCPHLLQLWAWAYIPLTRPAVATAYYPVPVNDDVHPLARPTLGYRFMHARLRRSPELDRASYMRLVADLDFLTADMVDWDPFSLHAMQTVAYGGQICTACIADQPYWMTTCHLLCMNAVEVYSPERVFRQFGMRQIIPVPPPRDAGRAHG